MAYTKQNFVDQQVLTAGHLNHIESGIAALDSEITELNNAKIEMELLWENASPTSKFANQTITVADKGQQMYMVVSSEHPDLTHIISPVFFYVGQTAALTCTNGSTTSTDGNISFYKRLITGSSLTSVTFGAGNYAQSGSAAWTGHNNMIIPRYIYGIKGVT